ncbi:hypothetical protein M1403_02580 [Patescibacteria group bacterium]|nr:hypothetical protein [Patescibacteria group bacterium]
MLEKNGFAHILILIAAVALLLVALAVPRVLAKDQLAEYQQNQNQNQIQNQEQEQKQEQEQEQEQNQEQEQKQKPESNEVEKDGSEPARPHFPLSVNSTTNQLIVTTPAGTKIVATLPQKAIDNMLSQGIVPVATLSNSASPSGIASSSAVTMTTLDNKWVYKIAGEKKFNVLGFIPVSLPVTAYVATDSGQILSQSQSLLSRFLDLLSFRF